MTALQVLRLVAQGDEWSARDIVVHTGAPPLQARMQLLRMMKTGYIRRRRVEDDSGLELWRYRLTRQGAKRLNYLEGATVIQVASVPL